MSRPTDYCSVCGEYVEERTDYVRDADERLRPVKRLVHIDGDRNRIHRGHAPKLDNRETA